MEDEPTVTASPEPAATEEVVAAPEPKHWVLHENGNKIEITPKEAQFVEQDGGRSRLVTGADGQRYHHVGAVPLIVDGDVKTDAFGDPIMRWTYREDV